ncbi:MAG: BREX system ATP-binding domain-containing protein, partial [Thermoplasmata archaeon]
MAERFPKNLVGREKELEFLKQKLEEAREGRGSTVFIAGESGVGKTRL